MLLHVQVDENGLLVDDDGWMDVARACGRKNLGVCGGGWMKNMDVARTCGWKTWMLFSRDPKEARQRASSEGQRRRPKENERSGEGTVRVHECVA